MPYPVFFILILEHNIHSFLQDTTTGVAHALQYRINRKGMMKLFLFKQTNGMVGLCIERGFVNLFPLYRR